MEQLGPFWESKLSIVNFEECDLPQVCFVNRSQCYLNCLPRILWLSILHLTELLSCSPVLKINKFVIIENVEAWTICSNLFFTFSVHFAYKLRMLKEKQLMEHYGGVQINTLILLSERQYVTNHYTWAFRFFNKDSLK